MWVPPPQWGAPAGSYVNPEGRHQAVGAPNVTYVDPGGQPHALDVNVLSDTCHNALK